MLAHAVVGVDDMRAGVAGHEAAAPTCGWRMMMMSGR